MVHARIGRCVLRLRTGTAWSRVVVGLVMAGFSSHSSSSAAALARTGLVVGISFRWLVVVGHVCQTRSLEEDATPLSTGAGDGNVNVTAVENREHCVGIPAGGNSGSNPGLGGALRPTSQSCKNLRHPAPLRQGGLPPFPPLLFYYTCDFCPDPSRSDLGIHEGQSRYIQFSLVVLAERGEALGARGEMLCCLIGGCTNQADQTGAPPPIDTVMLAARLAFMHAVQLPQRCSHAWL